MVKIAVACLSCIFFASVAEAGFPNYFNSEAIHYEGLSMFPKWTGVLARHNKDSNKPARKGYARWNTFISEQEGKSPHEQLEAVNSEMNRSEYIEDIVNWGVTDYWETPLQFLIKNGDCEDYAIIKYMSLKRLGFAQEDMRIVILQDRNTNLLHAVLVVNLEGEVWVLDNYVPQLLTASVIQHYQPIYSINEQAWWRHQPL